MILRDSALGRRRFLRALLGGWLGTLAVTLVAPLGRFLVPPTPEPESVDLPHGDFADMALHEVRRFAWGARPGLLQRRPEGFRAYVGVCTHLDCNVTWNGEQRRFHCACHDGWYDEDGRNVAGPPPRPLRLLQVEVAGDALVVRRTEGEA
ncbi:MAG: ubiquinol-cytochrome c reductase iron-sulfur subunit [Gemmatimonadota bacterium]